MSAALSAIQIKETASILIAIDTFLIQGQYKQKKKRLYTPSR
jgi:hypothetical protein